MSVLVLGGLVFFGFGFWGFFCFLLKEPFCKTGCRFGLGRFGAGILQMLSL